MNKFLLILAIFIPLTIGAEGQAVAVTATVTDPNGVPYSNGSARATLVDANGIDLTNVVVNVNGASIALPAQSKGLSSTGAMSFTLYPNTQISYTSATSWKFSICSPPTAGGISPPQTCFSSTISISGATDISATLKAAATVLVGTLTGGIQFPDGTVQSTATLSSAVTGSYDLKRYGAVCDGTTDDTPAYQAAINAINTAGNGGGILNINGVPGPCYLANPTTLIWATGNGPKAQITNLLSGKGLKLGSTFHWYDSIDFKGNSGYLPQQFQASGQIGSITAPTATGTLGTAITSVGAATFTPSVMTGLYPGTAISIDENITCTPTSITSNGTGQVTAVFPSACHIPPGAGATVAGVSCTVGFPGTWLIQSLDYPSNTIVWKQTIGAGSATGCTVTGYNEDRHEHVMITATTATTATATFAIAHSSTATWGVTAFVGTGLNHAVMDGVAFIPGSGYNVWLNQTFLVRFIHTWFGGNGGLASGGIDNQAQGDVWIDEQSYLGGDATIPSVGGPWGMVTCAGGTFIRDTYIIFGVKYACATNTFNPGNIEFTNDIFERVARGAFVYNPLNLGIGASTASAPPAQITFNATQMQDNVDGYSDIKPFVYSTTPSAAASNGTTVYFDKHYVGVFNNLLNSYAQLPIVYTGPGQGNLPTGRNYPVGTFLGGGPLKAELDGIGAGLGPSVIPYATLPVMTNPASWTPTGNASVATTYGPDGLSASAGTITSTGSGGGNVAVGSQSLSTYPGDWFIYGVWVRHDSTGLPNSCEGGNTEFILATTGTDTFIPGASTNQAIPTAYGSQWTGDWWHPHVALATVVTGQSGAHTITMNLFSGCLATGDANQFFQPFWMQIPGPNNPSFTDATLDKVERLRQELMHGSVVPNWNHPGFAATAQPVAFPSLLPTVIYSAAGTALPTCTAGTNGRTATVSDATAPTYRGSYTSGGTVTTQVQCDGASTTWLTH